MGEIEEVITARGHPNVTATHRTTLMVTRDAEVGREADCVVAVGADKGAAGLGEAIRSAIAAGAAVEVVIEVGGLREIIRGRGHGGLSLSDSGDLVIRKSDYACGRTLMIGADRAAADLSREFVECLKDPETMVRVVIRASR